MKTREKIIGVLRDADEPLSTDDIVARTGAARSTVYYNTSVLVKDGVLKRYKGIPGIFILAEAES